MGVDRCAPPRIQLGTAVVAAGSLLCVLGGLRSVPIFLPQWRPHSWYNTRYGMELLPALALGVGFAAQFAIAAAREFKPRWARYAAGILFAMVGLNAWQVVRERPLVYVEGTKNIAAHRPYQVEIPPVLRALLAERPGATILWNPSRYP